MRTRSGPIGNAPRDAARLHAVIDSREQPSGSEAGVSQFGRAMTPGLSFGESGVLFGGMEKRAIVVIDPKIMSGMPVFAGTRVPVRNLLDYLEGGDTLDEFLEQFPSVSREQAVAFLEQSCEHLLAMAKAGA